MQRSAASMRHRLGRAATLAAALSLLTVGLAAAAPGNNGTVKIHDGDSDEAPIINNEPHVGCNFHMHFFFGDALQSGEWRIEPQAPSPDGLATVGIYDAPNGEARVDTSLTTGHYKLYWDGDNGHEKHKTFWVDCPVGGGVGDVG